MSTSRHFPSNQIFLCRPWKFETGIERGEIMGCAVGEISIPEKKKTSSERDQKLYAKEFFFLKSMSQHRKYLPLHF